MKLNSLLDKLKYLLKLPKSGKYTSDDLEMIKELFSEVSDNVVLGTFFGYSVSDYAIATLKWLNTEETNDLYGSLIASISIDRKDRIEELIDKKIYLEI